MGEEGAAYEASLPVTFPFVGNAVLDTDDVLSDIGKLYGLGAPTGRRLSRERYGAGRTFTPFQNATRSATFRAGGVGSG